jgi:hypothetical protein
MDAIGEWAHKGASPKPEAKPRRKRA